jgi:hypothetical protein
MFPTSKSGPRPAARRKERDERNERNERNEQWPLGPHPSSDDVLDVAVEYTFPASDPIAAGCAEELARRERERKARETRTGRRDRPSSR